MKTRIITAVVGLIVLAGVLFTFDTLVFNLVIAAITLIALHEIYSALGFEKQDWPLLAVLVPYTLLIMLSSYSVCRAMVMPASFLVVLFYAIYLVVRNGVISYQKASGLAMFSGIVIFCFYSFIRLKEMLPVEEYGYDAIFFILLILCFAWGGDTCAYFAGRAFGKHKLCPVELAGFENNYPIVHSDFISFSTVFSSFVSSSSSSFQGRFPKMRSRSSLKITSRSSNNSATCRCWS